MGLLRSLSLAATALCVAASLPAQTAPATAGARGSVSGSVVADASGQPVAGAVVVLESSSDASVVTPSSSGAFLGRSLIAVTDVDGSYRFSALAPGAYRMVVRHLGFRPAVLEVDVTQPAPFRVSVALTVLPIRLEAMDSRATPTAPYARRVNVADERRFGRLDAEQFRTERFLEGDAAVLTHSDVLEAVTLGETDLFRAVQRLPGVSTRDDFTASLWTRGAPWSETRVYFDGMPLFNPVHAIGVFAGVNPDAVGTASFHPGVRSSSIGEGAAGVLNVTSRRPGDAGFGGLGEVSFISARGAAEWASPGGRTSAMVAARRSYVDFVTRLAESLGADSGTYIPYAFFDLTGRFDADLGRGHAIEASGLLEQDNVSDAVPGLLRPTNGRWGNRVGRVSLQSPLAGWRMKTTLGVSEFSGRMDPLNTTSAGALPMHRPMRNSVRAIIAAAEVSPAGRTTAQTWSAGIQLSAQRQRFDGPPPRPYPVVVLPDTLRLREEVAVVSLWGERRLALGRHAALELGLRADAHRSLRNASGLGLAPKLALRATPPGTRVTFTAAAGRSFQYTQALAPAGPSIGPDLYVTDVWLLANDTIPVLRSDIATVGAEAYIGAGWTASANLYARHSTGVAVPEPAPGALEPPPNSPNGSRPIFVSGQNFASGLELSVRRLVGAWTMSASYSVGRSMMKSPSGYPTIAGFYRYPALSSRRGVLDLTAMMRAGPSWRVGAAFTAASGSPFSRFVIDAACDQQGFCSGDSAATVIEMPNAERAPGYASLDLLADWSRTLRSGVQIGAFLQVRNVLNSANAVTYTGTLRQCTPGARDQTPVAGNTASCDRFDRGLPILPLAGIRIAF